MLINMETKQVSHRIRKDSGHPSKDCRFQVNLRTGEPRPPTPRNLFLHGSKFTVLSHLLTGYAVAGGGVNNYLGTLVGVLIEGAGRQAHNY